MWAYLAGIVTAVGSVAVAFAMRGQLDMFLPFLWAWLMWVAVLSVPVGLGALLYRVAVAP